MRWHSTIWRPAAPATFSAAARTLHAAQAEAVAMLADDPLLEAPEHALLEQQVQQMFEKAGAMN